MKRGRKGDQLTGGTGDVNPQTMQLSPVAQSVGADSFVVQATPLPIPRYPQQNGKSIVMEILGVYFNLKNFAVPVSASIQYLVCLSTNAAVSFTDGLVGIQNQMEDPRTVAMMRLALRTGAAASDFVIPASQYIDLTDNAGHGFLVATDNVFLTLNTSNTAANTNSASCKIEYRFKEVTLAEYVGIVQSQQ